MILRLAAIGLWLALAACTPPETDAARLARVAAAVAAQDDWMRAIAACPADSMPAAAVPFESVGCDGAALDTCLAQCRDDAPYACYWLAQTLQRADRDPRIVAAVFQRSCTLGEPSGCTNRAVSPEVAVTPACAVQTYERACALDDGWGCTMAARHFAHADGVAGDPERALRLLQGACANGDDHEACLAGRRLEAELREAQAAQ